MAKRITTKIIAISITFFILYVLLSQVNVKDIINIIITINPGYLAIGFLLYSISYALRALRFYFLLNREVKIKDLFCITCIHNLTNSILPARTGELSYIYLLKRNHKRPTEEGAATLIEARIFDMIAISLICLISATIPRELPEPIMGGMEAIVLFTAFLLILLVIFSHSDLIVMTLRIAAGFLNLNKKPSIDHLFRKMDLIANILEHMNLNKFFLCTLISIGSWMASYSVIYVLVIAMSINLPIGIVLLASTFSLLTSILPIQGFGGFGTMEGSWTIGFMLFGVSRDLAISSGFGVHIVTILYFLILGLIGLAFNSKQLFPCYSN